MLSDCIKCWETPCRCGHDYKNWPKNELRDFIQTLQKVLKSKEEKLDQFPFVVADLWRPKDPVTWENLSIYTYGKQVQFGEIQDAIFFKNYVDRNSLPTSEDNPHKIYRIHFEEVNV